MATIKNDGLLALAKLAGGVDSEAAFTYAALGTGTTAESQTGTTLEDEIVTGGAERKAATMSYEADYKTVWQVLWNFTATHAIYKIGIFNAAAAGRMLMEHLWASARNVDNGDSMEATLKMTAGRAA